MTDIRTRPSDEAMTLRVRPRLGFLGVGWIGRNRLGALAESGLAEISAICDVCAEDAARAGEIAPGATLCRNFEELLDLGLDGIVIATPSAFHAAQCVAALEAGLAVFCQKPLGRSAQEVEAVVAAARAADRLLGLDLSYRHTAAMQAVRGVVREGGLGRLFAADLVFHNAYGPDKAWFYDAAQSGGGCLVDLGVHLVDLLLWTLDFPEVSSVSANLFAGGAPLGSGAAVEDYVEASLTLEDGAVARIACSWKLHAGQDAIISAAFHGTGGGAEMRNVDGSFYDFSALRHVGTSSTWMAAPPDDWGGGAIRDWAARLARGAGFDPGADQFVAVARVLDRIYGR